MKTEPRAHPTDRLFMRIVGGILGVVAVAYPVIDVARALGATLPDAHWGHWTGIASSFVVGLLSVEFFTGHIVGYAGELVRALADRIMGKSRGEQ